VQKWETILNREGGRPNLVMKGKAKLLELIEGVAVGNGGGVCEETKAVKTDKHKDPTSKGGRRLGQWGERDLKETGRNQ